VPRAPPINCRGLSAGPTYQSRGLLAAVELPVAHESRGDRGLDHSHCPGRVPRHDDIVGQSIQEMERCRSPVRKAGPVNNAGLAVQERRTKTTRSRLRANTPDPGEGFGLSLENHLCHRFTHLLTLKVETSLRVCPLLWLVIVRRACMHKDHSTAGLALRRWRALSKKKAHVWDLSSRCSSSRPVRVRKPMRLGQDA